MNRFSKIVLTALLFLVLPMKQWAQQPQTVYTSSTISFDITEIANFDERIFFMYQLVNDGRFDVITSENDGVFVISANEAYEGINLQEDFTSFRTQNANAFLSMDKVQAAELSCDYKAALPLDLVLSLMMDVYNRSRQNNTCANSDPFCTDNGMYQFPAGVNAGSGESGPYYDCLYTTPNPAWYHMRIANPGNINIYMYSTPSHDIDFCCWGPFTDPISPCPNGLTSNKVVSCSYSINSTETCVIPSTAQTGDYFILVITNYSNQSCNISFSKTGGSGTTDCGILPPLVNGGGPYCVGETIYLTAQGQAGATYHWTGPGGFNSNLQNPTRPNCTLNMAGTYTCTITVGTQTNSATTEAVVVYPQPNANFTYTSVCRGTPTQFTSTSTTNPSGQQIQSYQWNFGDGQSGTGQNVSHTYANAGNYQVTLTTSCGNGNCTSSKTYSVPVYAAPVASATAQPNTVIYGGTATLTASAGSTGSFNFHWEPANKVVNPNAQTTQTVALQQTTTFTVTVTNPQGGCSSTAQVTVSMEGSNMTAMASADQNELCEGESTTLHALPSGGTGNYTYNWTPANTLSNPTSQHPVATPPVGTTTYNCAVSDGITTQNVSVTVVVHPNEVEDIDHYICENDTYNFYGEDIQTPGVYEHHTQTQYGCDKLIRLHLYNYDTYETPITDHFCQGEHYMFFDEALSSSGIYYHTLQSVHGCDSIIRLNLIQDPSYEIELWESTCEGGQGYYYNGDYLQPSPYPYTYHFETVLGCDSVVQLHVGQSDYNSKTYNVSICATEYTWPSNGMTYTSTGVYYDTLSYPNSCDSTLVLNLELRPSYTNEVVVTDCDSYRWKNDAYNVDLTFTESTVYTHHYVNSYGCNSEATLYLTINNHDEHSFTVGDDENCDNYYWDPEGHEIIYTDHEDWDYNMSGTYHRTYKNIYDCDSLVTMNVQFEYTPNPTEIYPMDATNTAPHWVITATEFQINAYEFNLWDQNPNCHWDSVTWSCDEAPQWVLEPFGNRNQCCRVYVLNQVDDTIWLKAHAFNRCAPEEGIEQRYWLLSSFYGIEDDGPSTGSGTFDVIPNPNNGQMTLNFEHLTGKVDVKVYDMRGILIDQFQTYNSQGPSSYTYNMKQREDGIYFFVATSKEGTVAKKVVIQK